MRKQKEIEIDGQKIIVREIATKDVIELTSTDAGLGRMIGLQAGREEDVYSLLLKCVDQDQEAFDKLIEGYAAYREIEAAWRELNADFLSSLPQRIEKMTGDLLQMVEKIKPGLSSTLLASLPKGGM